MKTGYIWKIIITVFLLWNIQAYADDVKAVKAVKFTGLKNIPQYEILNASDVSMRGQDILVDVVKLEKILSNIRIVKSFKLNVKENILLIDIVEYDPVYLLCVIDGEKNSFVEIDADFRFLSFNRVYAVNLPVIYVTKNEIVDNSISLRLKKFLSLIFDLKSSGMAIMKDVSEIDFCSEKTIFVTMNGRRTYFSVRPVKEDFLRLDRLAGYFDMIKYYPEYAEISEDKCIIR